MRRARGANARASSAKSRTWEQVRVERAFALALREHQELADQGSVADASQLNSIMRHAWSQAYSEYETTHRMRLCWWWSMVTGKPISDRPGRRARPPP